MTIDEGILCLAELRMERAVNTTADLLDEASIIPVTVQSAVTRIIIAANTIARALDQSGGDPEVTRKTADLLWRLGEGLGIRADGARD